MATQESATTCRHEHPPASILVPKNLPLISDVSKILRKLVYRLEQLAKTYNKEFQFYRDPKFCDEFNSIFVSVRTAATLVLTLYDFFALKTGFQVAIYRDPTRVPSRQLILCSFVQPIDLLQFQSVILITANNLEVLHNYLTSLGAESQHVVTIQLGAAFACLTDILDNFSAFGQMCQERVDALPPRSHNDWTKFISYTVASLHASHRLTSSERIPHAYSQIVKPNCIRKRSLPAPRHASPAKQLPVLPPPSSPSPPPLQVIEQQQQQQQQQLNI